MTSPFEIITTASGVPLAYLVSRQWQPEKTTFVTPDDFSLQMGMIVYGEGQAIPRHMHLPIVRQVDGTSEVLVVRKGACEVDLFDEQREFVASRRLVEGDIILLLRGAHGFRMSADTVLFEVKQGPYAEGRDKERF